MKKIFGMMAALLLSVGMLSSCDKGYIDGGKDTPLKGRTSTAVGTLQVDESGTPFTDQNITCKISFSSDTTTMIMELVQVKFSSNMPIRLNMTVRNIPFAVETNGDIRFWGNGLVPLAMGGEFPAYTINDLSGTFTKAKFGFTMRCGEFPVTYDGLIAQPKAAQ
ncbi:MAG: hypothetical protein PHV49_05455 [Alistipes sp.]|nr:hypothetical protein [Alistipes sp.]